MIRELKNMNSKIMKDFMSNLLYSPLKINFQG